MNEYTYVEKGEKDKNKKIDIYVFSNTGSTLCELKQSLKNTGYNDKICFSHWRKAEEYLQEKHARIVILDLDHSGEINIDHIRYCLQKWPGISVIVISPIDEVSFAVECMKNGASDYFTRPLDVDHLINSINTILNKVTGHEKPRYTRPESAIIDTINQAGDWQNILDGYLPEKLHRTLFMERRLARSGGGKSHSWLIQEFIDYLIKPRVYCNPKLTLSLAAKELNTNTSYLSKAINSSFDISFRKLLNRLRLAVALKRMGEGELEDVSIEGLACEVGFTRRATFYTAFKAETGHTPGQTKKD